MISDIYILYLMFCEADASLLFWLMILRVRVKRLHILCILMSKEKYSFALHFLSVKAVL